MSTETLASSPLFDALPGIETPVAKMHRALESIWETGAGEGAAPSEFRASQMNLVLHFGLPTTPAEAVAQFDVALKFARRYPCRIIVLIPQRGLPAGAEPRAKLYSQCFVGASLSEKSCTEALLLNYPEETRAYISDLASTLIESDLPLYYWVHHFAHCRKVADYQYLLRSARRFIVDSAIVPEETLAYPWPRPETLRDLAAARLLPVRQIVGQYLAGIDPAQLAKQLEAVTVRSGPALGAEAKALLRWTEQALTKCDAASAAAADFETESVAEWRGEQIELALRYGDARFFRWRADLAAGTSQFDTDFGQGRVQMPAPVKLLAPEAALSEALFF